MIKVGITGAESEQAGELLRLLIHHPDVEILTAQSSGNAGKPAMLIHHGLIGEERMVLSSGFDATSLDMVFLVKPLYSESDWRKLMADRPGLKIVLWPESGAVAEGFERLPVYGISELNRKQLVRGARSAMLPNPIASMVLVALFPLASHLMIPDTLNLQIEAPEDIITEEMLRNAKEEISEVLKVVQSSFGGDVNITATPTESDRAMRMRVELPGSTTSEELFKIYDSIYDDHNFTYMVPMDVDTKEVEGTQRCIISLSKPEDDTIGVAAVADPRMRGGAGEAVHLMNLLFGLHEKTGLNLKASRFR